MDEIGVLLCLGFLLFLLALCGPAALVVSIIALVRIKKIYNKVLPPVSGEIKPQEKIPSATIQPLSAERKPAATAQTAEIPKARPTQTAGFAAKKAFPQASPERIREKITIEQQIGTKWILIAGVITVIVGMVFFLKYAYDNNWIGPAGRVFIAAVVGLAALFAGEVTRRKGYGIVAKGMTALGFAILYAAIFGAYRFYELIPPLFAFVLAIIVTASAMFYAVKLNEILIAVLSLLGGFLTPVILSTGENRPITLFTYILILGTGAILCAYYRKWRLVDVLCFAGTFVMYVGWFEKFYRPDIRLNTAGYLQQMPIALGWLGLFFIMYLVLPVLYELIRHTQVTRREDVSIVLANAAITFFYLWTVLFDRYRVWLAFAALAMCAAHLIIMTIVIRRCPQDIALRLSMLVISLFFLTIAVPLYLKMYAIAIAWAAEAMVLTIIAMRYRSMWTLIGSGVVFLLSISQLIHHLPMHSATFTPVINPAFGTWCFVAASALLCHIIHRTNRSFLQQYCLWICQIFYVASMLLLMVAAGMELDEYCKYNVSEYKLRERYFDIGMVLLFTIFTLLFSARPLCPAGIIGRIASLVTALVGSVFTIVMLDEFYSSSFTIFANTGFGNAVVFVVSLFLAGWLIRLSGELQFYDRMFSLLFAVGAIIVLWVLLTEQIHLYWYWRNVGSSVPNWKFLANMYISIMWAIYGAMLMIIGFWRKSEVLRYMALGLFVLLLAKVFIVDTSTVKNVYRIAAFLATGVTLVGISYLYRHLKKKGFFDAMLGAKK